MTETEWTPARGWAKAALQMPIRIAVAVAAILGPAWVLDALLDSLGIVIVHGFILPFGAGAIGGALAGWILCAKLGESTGHAGRTLLPLGAVAIAITQWVAWHAALLIVPWEPTMLVWFIGPSVAASLLVMMYCLWAEG